MPLGADEARALLRDEAVDASCGGVQALVVAVAGVVVRERGDVEPGGLFPVKDAHSALLAADGRGESGQLEHSPTGQASTHASGTTQRVLGKRLCRYPGMNASFLTCASPCRAGAHRRFGQPLDLPEGIRRTHMQEDDGRLVLVTVNGPVRLDVDPLFRRGPQVLGALVAHGGDLVGAEYESVAH